MVGALSVPVGSRATLEEIHVYDLPPRLRVVLDFSELPVITVSQRLASGEVAVELRDTALATALQPLPPPVARFVAIEAGAPAVTAPLVVRVRAGAPLALADHFALRQVSDLVLDLERASVASGELTALAASPAALVWPPAEAGARVDASSEAMAAAVAPAPLNIPPEQYLAGQPLSPESGLSAPASVRDSPAQRMIDQLSALGGSIPSGLLDMTEQTMPEVPEGATGRTAPSDEYPTTPPGLEELPRAIAGEYRANLQQMDRAANIDLLSNWLKAHRASGPLAERMTFLVAEQRYWMAREAAAENPSSTEGVDWLGAINDFRAALRHAPDSEWAPLAWLRIHDCYLRMGWTEEALATLESFQRAGTDYSVGTILLRRAQLLRQLGRWEEEIEVLAQHLELDPEGPGVTEALLRLGEIYHARGERMASYNAFHRAWQIASPELERDPDRHLAAIETAVENADFDWAERMIVDLLASHPGREREARVALLLAQIYRHRGRVDVAMRIYQELLEREGETPQTLQALIRLADQGRADAAEGVDRGVAHPAYRNPRWAYEHVADAWPQEEIAQVALLRLGEVLLASGEHHELINRLSGLLRDHPDTPLRPNVEDLLSQALARALREALARGDDLAVAQLYATGHDGGFAQHLPDETLWGVAQATCRLGLWEQSAALTTRLLRRWQSPRAPALPWEEVLSTHVESLRRSGRLAEALESVERCLAEFPAGHRRTDLLHARAEILHGLARHEETLAAAEEALASGGSAEQRTLALFLRADATKRLLGPDLAVPLYIEALQAYQKSGRHAIASDLPREIVFELGDCFYQTGNWDRARVVCEELLAQYPQAEGNDLLRYRLAHCLARAGQLEQAHAEVSQIAAETAAPLWQSLARQSETDLRWIQTYPDLFAQGGVIP